MNRAPCCRHLAVAGLLALAVLFVAACSGGSTTSQRTGSVHTGSVHTGSVHTGSVHTGSADTGSVHTGSTDTGSVDTGSQDSGIYDSPYCEAARTYDADLSHFSATDTQQLNQAVKDVTDLHSKAPAKVKGDYAVLLSTLRLAQDSGAGAITSDKLDTYQVSFHKIIEFDHTNCGLPLYGDATAN